MWLRDEGRCIYCGKGLTPQTMHLDHVVPVARGGSGVTENLVASCERCQWRKADKLPEELELGREKLAELVPEVLKEKLTKLAVDKIPLALPRGESMRGRSKV